MLLKMIMALGMLVMLAHAMALGIWRLPEDESARDAAVQYEALRGFAYSVDQYVKANAGFSGELVWRQAVGQVSSQTVALAEQSTTPPGLRGMAMPPSWRAVADDGDYVICAAVSERVLRRVGAGMPATLPGVVVAGGSGHDFLVFDDVGNAEARAARCR
ncbi:hypothetical protein EDC22_105225 [Tepidamorphus gemmatus]|uniref:Uncharacterized protein n=1 Tax=Tepidamorphus gemmatus TaxID=747076 RepID=A0A4R3MGG0_9HYPH|nr:hypothetical protein [Tepidamorphus gemmatus]TCT10725.1 hypothetical protein EDC22_105225 [Tepidamorphus gemmatus]